MVGRHLVPSIRYRDRVLTGLKDKIEFNANIRHGHPRVDDVTMLHVLDSYRNVLRNISRSESSKSRRSLFTRVLTDET